jgi:hypothetical protein
MNQEIELELVSGMSARLTLPEPGEFPSFYVFSMEYSGSFRFWRLLERLMTAAGRPLCNLETLRCQAEKGNGSRKFTDSAQQKLLVRPGYGFGIFYDVSVPLRDVFAGASAKLLFLRDPRDMIVSLYRHLEEQSLGRVNSAADNPALGEATGAPMGFAEFLESPEVEHVAQRYRRFAELRDREQNVILLRYEHALADWHATAADLKATLKLPIGWQTAAALAADTSPIGNRLPLLGLPPDRVSPMGADDPESEKVAGIEARFGDVLAALGYASRPGPNYQAGRPPLDHLVQTTPQTCVTGPRVERDPVLHSRLRPNSSAAMEVLGRKVIMSVDGTGCRPVIGQPAQGVKTFAVYGCSYTYGNAVAAEETFCSLLQESFPDWRVENHGVPGYGTTQNLIQLERDTRWNKPEIVTFCWIDDHLRRNGASVDWVQWTSPFASMSPGNPLEQQIPRAGLDTQGALELRSVRFPRHDLIGIDLSDYAPDPYYLGLVCFRLFERANAIVTGYGGHFFVTTLNGRFSAALAERLADSGIPVVDASLSGEEYTCLPDDPHPNPLANRFYSDRIRHYLKRYSDPEAAAVAPGLPRAFGVG